MVYVRRCPCYNVGVVDLVLINHFTMEGPGMDIRRIGLVSATVLSVFAAYASDKSFFAADGGWEVDANWSPSGVPAAGDVVKIPVGTV